MPGKSLTVTWMAVMMTFAHQCLCIDQCPAAEEGKPYSLRCDIPRQYKHGHLDWILTTEDGKQKIMFSCDGIQCENVGGHHSNYATASIYADYSTLNIPNVTSTQRDAVYTCRVTDEKQDSRPSQDIVTCSMNLYYSPTNLDCRIETVDTDILRVSCSTAKTYPSVTCELWERFNLDKTKPQNATFKYQKKRLTDSSVEYYSVQCAVDVVIDHPGSYQFFVFTTPDVKNKNFTYSEKRGVITENKIVSDNSAVEIKQSVDEGCKDSVEFQCKATFFTNRPKFMWYLGDEAVRDSEIQSAKVSKGNKNYYTSVSKLVLKKPSKYDGKFLKCIASTITSQKENQTRIVINSWPPNHPPVFKDINGALLGLVFDINELDNVTLFCEIKGGKPKISLTRVQCWDSNSGSASVDEKSEEDSVRFIIRGSENFQRRRCKCSGEHSSACYNATETMTFVQVPVNGSSRVVRNSDTSKSDYIFIIVGVTLGCIFLICIFAVFKMYWRHWHDLYYSVYHYFLPPPRRPESSSEDKNFTYLNVPPPIDRSRKPREAVNEWLLRNETQNNPRRADNQLTDRPAPIKPRPHRSQNHIAFPSSRSLPVIEETALKFPYTGSETKETSLKSLYTGSEREKTSLQNPYGKSSTSLDSRGYLKVLPDLPGSSHTRVQVHPNYKGVRKQSAP